MKLFQNKIVLTILLLSIVVFIFYIYHCMSSGNRTVNIPTSIQEGFEPIKINPNEPLPVEKLVRNFA